MDRVAFREKISALRTPVVVDVWAPWCAPCRATTPILEELAKEYAGRVAFLPVNADDSHEVVEQLHVLGIPTVLTFKGGREVGRVTGARNDADYRALFEAVAEGKDGRLPLAPFDRILRLGAGGLFLLVGASTGNMLVAAIGGAFAILGAFDRCPILTAIAGRRGWKGRREEAHPQAEK